MRSRFSLLLLAVLTLARWHSLEGVRLKITKINCNLTDPEFAVVHECKLKAVSRNLQYIQGSGSILQPPVTSGKVRVQIMKRLNGWKPFLYDVSVSCGFMKRLNAITSYVWAHVRNMTNLKHDCPYHETYFETKRIDNQYVERALTALPVPTGDYAVFVTITANEKVRGQGSAFGTIS